MVAISTKITNKLDNGYVQVDVSAKKNVLCSYKLPEDKADSFCKEYQNMYKKNRNTSLISHAIAIFGSTFGGFKIANAAKLEGFKQILAVLVPVVLVDFITTVINNKVMIKRQDKLFKEYQVKSMEDEKLINML